MDEDRDLLWRIDAWDTLAGRAFLCRRGLDGADAPELDRTAVFVAPPFFQPEPLASRAPGLAATRGTFQYGLFVSGGEAGFTTLDDAIAFIRRGYNSHGSDPFPGAPVTRREGPTGRGGPGLALDLPELPRTPGFRQLDLAIATCAIEFEKAHSRVALHGPAERIDWSKVGPSTELQHSDDTLLVAGQELVLEMLRRFPRHGSPEDYVAWSNPALSLGMQLSRLGLWVDVRDAVAQRLSKYQPSQDLQAMVDTIAKLAFPDHKIEKGIWPVLDMLFSSPYGWRWDFDLRERTDVYAELAHYPIPQSIAERYKGGPADASVLRLLSRSFGHMVAADKGATELDRALLLFGGACVVIRPLQRENPAYSPLWIDQNSSVRRIFALRLGQEAWSWISQQLPDRAFDSEYEKVLREIPQVWTRAATAKKSDSMKLEEIAALGPHEVDALREELGDVISDLEEEVLVRYA